MIRAIICIAIIAAVCFAEPMNGYEGEDIVEEVMPEVGYHYTFEIDSSYTPWSYTFSAPETLYHPLLFQTTVRWW